MLSVCEAVGAGVVDWRVGSPSLFLDCGEAVQDRFLRHKAGQVR